MTGTCGDETELPWFADEVPAGQQHCQ